MRLVTRWQISYERGTEYSHSERSYTYAEAQKRVERLNARGNLAYLTPVMVQAPLARGTRNGRS